jgi:hypothetical protein
MTSSTSSSTYLEEVERQRNEFFRRVIEHEKNISWGKDIICLNFYRTIGIQKGFFQIPNPTSEWWSRGEMSIDGMLAKVGDTFLWNRCDTVLHRPVESPTPEEIPRLIYKKAFLKKEMRYYRPFDIVYEYGSTRLENGKWIRHQVAYIKGDVSPYPFTIECFDPKFEF